MGDVDIVLETEVALSQWMEEHCLRDYDVEWWAVALLKLEPGSYEYRVRKLLLEGHRPGLLTSQAFWGTWAKIVTRAREVVMKKPLAEWLDHAYNHTDKETGKGNAVCQAIRDAALISPRSFVEFIGLKTDEGRQIKMKDFHTKTVCGMRQVRNFLALLPFEHGKTVLSSMVVPLMDWSEWQDCSQIRMYLDNDTIQKQVSRLKQQVEHNDDLHKLFPWVRRPAKGDASSIWNETSFSIGGRTIADPSFKALTINAGRMGFRAHRVGVDDVVTSTESESMVTQDKYWHYIETGPFTFPQQSWRQSRYGTQFPSYYQCGTLFSPMDVNSRAQEKFDSKIREGDREYGSKIFDIYPRGAKRPDLVLWPEYKDAAEVKSMKERLGWRTFQMRCRNRLHLEGLHTFPEAQIRAAEMDGQDGKPIYEWGVVPEGCITGIGFDPASGKLNRGLANPAIFLYGMRHANLLTMAQMLGPYATPEQIDAVREDVIHHWIKWAILPGFSMTRQADFIIEWARQYMCPVFIEDNQTQIAYSDYITKVAPDVIVTNHSTQLNKIDPDQGVEQFVPLLENHKIIIHAADAPADELTGLRRELVNYSPGKNKRLKDRVMAAWIARYQLQLSRDRANEVQVNQYAPVYARPRHNRFVRPRNFIDLSGRY